MFEFGIEMFCVDRIRKPILLYMYVIRKRMLYDNIGANRLCTNFDLCMDDVLSVRLLQGTEWFCIIMNVLRASNNVALFRKGQANGIYLIRY